MKRRSDRRILVPLLVTDELLEAVAQEDGRRPSLAAVRRWASVAMENAVEAVQDMAAQEPMRRDGTSPDDDEPSRHDLREHPLDADGLYRCTRCGTVGGYTGGPVECGEELDADGCNECDGERLLACCDWCRDRPHRHEDRSAFGSDGRLRSHSNNGTVRRSR